MVTLAYPKALKLEDRSSSHVKRMKGGFIVKLTAEHPALWTWLSLDGTDARLLGQTSLHSYARLAVEIRITPSRRMSKAEFTKTLRVQSLFDTYAR